jgi:acyl carrier protein
VEANDRTNQLLALISRELDCDLEIVQPSIRLEHLPMDSLEYVHILQTIRTELGPIDEIEAQNCETVSELAEAIG